MTIIKRFVNWLINLLKKIFGIKKNNNHAKEKNKEKKYNNQIKNGANIFFTSNDSLPSYMITSNNNKEILINSINLMINNLLDSNIKKIDSEEKKLVKLIKDKYDINVTGIINLDNLKLFINHLDEEKKLDIINKYQVIHKNDEDFKVHVEEINKVVEMIRQKDISILEENAINDEINTINNDKDITNNTIDKIDYFNKHVIELIDNVDKYFIKEVVKEYQKVNYITVATMIIDKSYVKFKQLQDDYHHHRYNRNYYEREINKLKNELNQIKDLKNRKEIALHIEILRKELYTKSKDKYDLLYNNEVFMEFDKECDILLDKINAKVVDIKKEKIEEKKDDKNKYLENILLRFKDMELAREIILLSQQNNNEILANDEKLFIFNILNKYDDTVNQQFNFERNKKKTELVIRYNELNMAICNIKKEPYILISHINFRMEDLIEAVEAKEIELNRLMNKDSEDIIKKENQAKTLVYKNKENKK